MTSDDRDTRLPTPFASPSWEPRFALDFPTSPPALAMALRLHVGCRSGEWDWREGEAVFYGFRLQPDRAVVAVVFHGPPRAPDETAPLFAGVTLEVAAAALADWLTSEAVYPARPWFDGDEERGFQAWHVPYGDPGPYGFLVVEPKWFEVHK